MLPSAESDITAGMAALSLPSQEVIELAPYEYHRLPDKHIRILQIHARSLTSPLSPFWKDTETIHCTIKTVDLDKEPGFDALSYTWGNPITVYEDEEKAKEGAEIFSQVQEIVCDGMSLKITTNLHDALLAIRQVPSFKDVVERPRGEYIWIDAICINQEDIEERNAQVAIMDRIYSMAKIVIVWLGRDDAFTQTGVEVLREVSKIPEPIRAIPLMKVWSTTRLFFRELKEFGLRQFKEEEWLSVYAFLERNWFRRAWILQELGLARRIVVMTGLLVMDWPTLEVSCTILALSGWDADLGTYAEKHMKGHFEPVMVDFSGEVVGPGPRDKPFMYQREEEVKVEFNAAGVVLSMSDIRRGLGIADRKIAVLPYRKPLDFTGLMNAFRRSVATDPRDKVYALCGLLPKDRHEAKQEVLKIIPDYNKSVEGVFIDAAWFQLQSANNLDFLGLVQDLAQCSVKNLPSWVPDLTVRPLANRLSVAYVNRKSDRPTGEIAFFAAEGLHFATPLLSQPMATVSLQGKLFDFVEEVIEFNYSKDLSTLINLLSDLPHIDWKDVRRYIKNLSMTEVNVILKGGYLKGIVSSEESDMNPGSETGSSSRAEILIPDGEQPRIQTFLEVLWRTLIADNWEGQHPAPLEAGYAFVGCLIEDIRSDFFKAVKDQSPEEQSEKLLCLKTLAQAEKGGFSKSMWYPALNKVVTKSAIDPVLASFSVEVRDYVLTRFMPQIDDPMDLIWSDDPVLQQNALWIGRCRQVMGGRKLFRTQHNQYLGAGSKSVEVGDVVCVLAGGSVPYVIRPVGGSGGDGAENKSRFVGEAYVHGAMHGEAVRDGFGVFKGDHSLLSLTLNSGMLGDTVFRELNKQLGSLDKD